MLRDRCLLICLSSLASISCNADQESSNYPLIKTEQSAVAFATPMTPSSGKSTKKPIATSEKPTPAPTKSIKKPSSTSKKPTAYQECWSDDFKCKKQIFSIYGEWLYFKAIEDSLKYAQKIPQKPTLTPHSPSIDQHFDYNSGFRIGLGYQLPRNNWEIFSEWMRYTNHNQAHHHSDDFNISAVLILPTFQIEENALVGNAKSRWSLEMDSVELALKMPLHISRRFILAPIGGVKAGFVDQKIDVHYSDFMISQPAANTPQHVKGKNDMWGVGPLIGVEMKFLLPRQYGFFFSGNIAGLCGNFTLKTTYNEFLNAPDFAKVTVTDSKFRVALVEQLQAGIEKKWIIKRNHHQYLEIDIAAGWEVQVWEKQMRLSLFNVFIESSNGADLTLYGPFVRAALRF